MYAFRKPFAAASFEGEAAFGVEAKTAFVVAQVIGYTVSKFLGVKLVSELAAKKRRLALIATVVMAELALLVFAVAPTPLRVACLFFNGLPLGFVWGLVVRYLEGRRQSEILLAGLSVSFIVASGAVKDVGRWLLGEGITEAWMPAAVGAMFFPLFVVSVIGLDRLPAPSRADIEARSERGPMSAEDRRALLRRHAVGFGALFVVYFFLTAYRDFRDNYGVEIFEALGQGGEAALFTRTELPVAFGVLVCMALLNLVRDNRRAVAATFGCLIVGMALLAGGTWLHRAGAVDAVTWMICTGLGSYLAYVPYGSVLFDRILAATGTAGTAVFAIYVADALGYTGSVLLQLGRDVFFGGVSRLAFFEGFTWALALGGAALLLVALRDFLSERATGSGARPARPASPR